jgi:hypothetical protein
MVGPLSKAANLATDTVVGKETSEMKAKQQLILNFYVVVLGF